MLPIVINRNKPRFNKISSVWSQNVWYTLARVTTARVIELNVFSFVMAGGAVSQTIAKKLTEAFKPHFLNVINESYMHNVPKGSETHFKVVVISEIFKSEPLLQRHRMVNEVLKEELASGVHALSIQAKTPQQWDNSGQKVPVSPPCMGGSKR